MARVCGVNADVHDVPDFTDVVERFRQFWLPPLAVLKLKDAVGLVPRGPGYVDATRGHPEVVVPAIDSSHCVRRWTNWSVSAGANARRVGVGHPGDDPTNATAKPHLAPTWRRVDRQIFDLGEVRFGLCNACRRSLIILLLTGLRLANLTGKPDPMIGQKRGMLPRLSAKGGRQ